MGFRTFAETLECAHAIEELGFTTLYASDHMLGVSSMAVDIPAMEPWTLITALAAATKRLRFGVLVSGVTYRHPSMLAKIASTVDVVSNGRLDIGIGGAWSKDDHLAFGLDFPPLAERQERLREAVEILDGLLTRPSFSYQGRHYRLQDAVVSPGPVQKPRPPILLAAVGEAGIEIAARHAQMWCAVVTPAFAADRVALLSAKARAIGRDPSAIECAQYSSIFLSDDAREVGRTLEAGIARITDAKKRPVLAQARNTLEGELVEERAMANAFIGNAEQVTARIRAYVAAGVTHFIIMTPRPFDRRLIEKFRKEVMTQFIGN